MIAKKFNRRSVREKALQVLYAFDMNGEGLSYLLDGILSDITNKEHKDFCKKIVNTAIANREQVDLIIAKHVENWEMNRIAIIDKLLLRIGITELLYFPEIPPKVTINEVIEIGKEFSTKKTGKFLNGILDAILIELKESGKLNKTGRGLVEESIPRKTLEE